MGRQFDDLVRDIARGAYVPLTLRTGRGLHRFWASTTDRDTFLANGGVLADHAAGPDDPDAGCATGSHPPHAAPRGRRGVQCVLDRAERRHRRYDARPPRDTGEPLRPAPTAVPPTAVPPIAAPAPVRPERPPVAPLRPGVCSAGTTPCGAEARLYPGGWLCERHRPGSDFGRPGVVRADAGPEG